MNSTMEPTPCPIYLFIVNSGFCKIYYTSSYDLSPPKTKFADWPVPHGTKLKPTDLLLPQSKVFHSVSRHSNTQDKQGYQYHREHHRLINSIHTCNYY